MDLTQRDLLAKTLQAEAGNQGYNGMVAVGSVIMNRLAGGSDLGKVILQPGHFSAWNGVTGYAGGEQGQDMDFTPSARSYEVADALLSGNYEDPTGGATHYYNPALADPIWGASGGGEWQTIGSHIFGKANKAGPKPIPNNGTLKPSLEAEIFGDVKAMDGQVKGQQMQPTAQQMQQMQQTGGLMGQQTGGLMGMLRDPRTRQIMSAFSRSRVGEKLGALADRDREVMRGRETDNKTAQWLSTQEGGKPYAQAILQGAMTGSQAYERWLAETQREGTKIGDRIVDPITGEVIYEDKTGKLDKDKNAIINQQNTAIYKLMKPYNEIFNAYGQISRAIAAQRSGSPSGVNDLVISISFSKLLDPESVVRAEESEAVSAAGGGVAAAFGGLMNFLGGEGSLTPAVRNQIMSTTQKTADTWYKMVTEERERSLRQAELSGISRDIAEQVLVKPKEPKIDPLPQPASETEPEGSQPNGTITQSALDAGLTQAQWDLMTAQEIADFP